MAKLGAQPTDQFPGGLDPLPSSVPRRLWPSALLASFLITIGLASAAEVPVFGPEDFERESGRPVTELRSFTVPDPSGTFILRIHNGGVSSKPKDRVTAAIVRINGDPVALPRDFKRHIEIIEEQVLLRASNELSVLLLSGPGRKITIEILQIVNDADPPMISASQDPGKNAAGWNNTAVTVSFTCTDAGSGIASCTAPVIVATEGEDQEVVGEAVDNAGNSSSTSYLVSIDLTPPGIACSADPPANVNGWNNSDVTVSCVCSDALSMIESCPAPAVVTTEGADQPVEGTACDLAGNCASETAFVSLDKTPPLVTIASPADGFVSPTTEVTLEGSLEDAHPAGSVDCNGISASLDPNGSFTCLVPLALGVNSITVCGEDLAGNVGCDAINVESPPPLSIRIEAPASPAMVGAATVDLSGTFSGSVMSIVCQSAVLPAVTAMLGSGAFTAPGVPVREGPNNVSCVASDGSGRAATATVFVDRDTTPPTVVIELPAPGAEFTTATVTVLGNVNDPVAGTLRSSPPIVKVNGVTATVTNGTFVAAGVPLPAVAGDNTIVAVATDEAGNASQQARTVRRVSPPVGQRIVLVSGNDQSGLVRSILPEPLKVKLQDVGGNAVAGGIITFEVTRSDGLLVGAAGEVRNLSVATDVAGEASAGLRLGSISGAGSDRVRASATGYLGEVRFCHSASAGPASRISIVSGQNQAGAAGASLPRPLVVLVTDATGSPVEDVEVLFEVLSGGGSFGGGPSHAVFTGADGRASALLTLGPAPGVNSNSVRATFMGLVDSPANFTASSRATGLAADTRVAGVVLDNAEQPIPGATVSIEGTALSDVTDAEGQFLIPGAPVGSIRLFVDGSTAPPPGVWPSLEFDIISIAGAENGVGMPIRLPPVSTQTESSKIVGGSQDVVLTLSDVPGFQLKVFANSATFPGGAHVARLTVTQVPATRVPMPAPNGSAFTLAWTIQPPNVAFDPPARIQVPNPGLPPGHVVEMFSFDHDAGQFVSIGSAAVSDDGAYMAANPGFGISKTGWGGFTPPPPPPACVARCGPCQVCAPAIGACVADTAKNGMACEDVPADFTQQGVNVMIDASCAGRCQAGTCGNSTLDLRTGTIRTSVVSALNKLFTVQVPLSFCVDDPLRTQMQDDLIDKGIRIRCATGTSCASAPGWVSGNNDINVFDAATRTACGPMASTVLHELVHAAANYFPEDKPRGCEASCYMFGSGDPGNCR